MGRVRGLDGAVRAAIHARSGHGRETDCCWNIQGEAEWSPSQSCALGSGESYAVLSFQAIKGTLPCRLHADIVSQAAIELLERHAPSFADRPRAIAAGEVLSGGMRTLLIPKGERIKKLRR